ncbi:MAG: NACHT domain-containing protein [Anaerolineae bacterium]|nr:NACHT domain-containing protein [Anaerolineae bacterium]MDW8098088.1 NACHT domain-containing protein [Anaerolineae bacterium]
MGQRDFLPELFTEPSEYEETPLRDRKQELPNLYRDDKKAEILRDIIALANTARQWGKPAYLLFGLDNQGNLRSILGDLEPYRSSNPVPEPENKNGIMVAMENVRQQLGRVIGQYIAPQPLLWELQWGWLNNQLLAYLRIEPQCPPNAFRVDRDLISGGRQLLYAGGCWIRSGESRMQIAFQSLSLDTPGYCQVPFVAPSRWLCYFERLRNSREIEQAINKNPYLDLRDSYGEDLEKIVRQFLETDESILVIKGPPGCGKSTFLSRLVAKKAEDEMAMMKGIRQREEFRGPPDWIPIYFPLRGAHHFSSAQDFAKELLRNVNAKGRFWETEPSTPEKLLENPNLSWLICLDGLDELWAEERIREFLEILRTFSRRYPRVKILLTTRPVITVPDDLRCAWIAPLSLEQMLTYLRAFVTETNESIYQQLEKEISDHESEIRKICTVPLYLESLASLMAPEALQIDPLSMPTFAGSQRAEGFIRRLKLSKTQLLHRLSLMLSKLKRSLLFQTLPQLEPTQWKKTQAEMAQIEALGEVNDSEETGPSLTLGWVLDRMIRRVWDREASRRAVERAKLHRWWRATGKLSLEMDGHKCFMEDVIAQGFYSSEQGIWYVLNLAILSSSEKGISFSHRVFQHYFGAAYLREDDSLFVYWKRRCKPDFWQSVLTILNQIQYPGGIS